MKEAQREENREISGAKPIGGERPPGRSRLIEAEAEKHAAHDAPRQRGWREEGVFDVGLSCCRR